MLLKGSCHCGSVRFELESEQAYPFCLCYCSICRKTVGGGGYAINLGGRYQSLKVDGMEHVNVYHAEIDGEPSTGARHFCRHCGSGLWLYDPTWPELVHPFASAIDTELPVPPERTHIMVGSKANWVPLKLDLQDRCFDGYPDESLAEWHERQGLTG